MGNVVMCFWVSLAKASRTPKFGHPLTNPKPNGPDFPVTRCTNEP